MTIFKQILCKVLKKTESKAILSFGLRKILLFFFLKLKILKKISIFAKKLNNFDMDYPNCPKCKGNNTYSDENNFICPDCFHEWNPTAETEITENDGKLIVKDASGTILQDGDTVVTIKNLPLKGSSQTIKAGTKVKKIRLTEGDHNIACKIDGFGELALKSEFVKKA